MALAGNIKEFGLADIFQIVSLQQKTGMLTVAGPEGKVMVLLENGFIVGADATFRPIEERLQQSLVRSQTITNFQLKRAVETQKKTLQPLWTVLAETGALDTGVLQSMLSQQIHETVYHLLRWIEGEYRFEPKKTVEYDRQLISPVNTEFLVMEGFRLTDEWSEIEKEIPSFQLVVRRTSELSVPLDDLTEAETKVYNVLATEHTVQDVIDICQLGEFDTCQTIYQLMKKTLVERVQSKKGNIPQIRRVSVGVITVFTKILTLLVGIGILIALFVLITYLPENFTFIHHPALRGLGRIKQLAAQSQLNSFSHIIPRYFLEHKEPPKSFEELQQQGFITSTRVIKDPWGNAYTMSAENSSVLIRSYGNDGKLNTDDDIKIVIPF